MPQVRNWFGHITTEPAVVVEAHTADDLVEIMKDHERYPRPVRAHGSNHSTTACGIAGGGTIVQMRNMKRIVGVGADTVTAEAGALYLDVNQELRRHGKQFYVNVELGNLTIGSAACGGTKDASMPGEYGQVCSYVQSMKLVTPAGEVITIDESDPDLLQAARSSYGLFGIIYEATFKVRPLKAMHVHHKTYKLDDFCHELPDLLKLNESMMFYFRPFADSVTVEYRKYLESQNPAKANRFEWRLRNWAWKTAAPWFSAKCTRYIPSKRIRYALIDAFYSVIILAVLMFVRDRNTDAIDQMIRYPDRGGSSKYTFSIWAFEREGYERKLREYYEFCKDYYRRTGYRCDMLNVGYRIAKDQSSLFSYSFDGEVLTIDPVATGNPGWDEFLVAYNEFCSQRDGVPLFNQSHLLTREQVEKAFAGRLETFRQYRKRFDPDDRVLNEYFADVLA